MAKIVMIRTKSGKEYHIELDPDVAAEKTAEELAKSFFTEMDFNNLITLRLGTHIFYLREVESFNFS